MSRISHIKFLLVIVLFVSQAVPSRAQGLGVMSVKMDSTILKLTKMTVDDYASIELPPLDTLYKNAWMMSNAVKFYKYEAEYYHHVVTTERLKPLEWIRVFSTYNYGNIDMSAISLMQTTYQVWTQAATSQSNNYYNVGVTINIPILDIFNQRNRVRQARAKAREQDFRSQAELDAIKQEIIECYCSIMQNMTMLKAASERLVIAKAQYDIAETDFVNNKIEAEALYRSKNFESSAVDDYERIKKQLNMDLLRMEVISCTPIVSNLKIVMED